MKGLECPQEEWSLSGVVICPGIAFGLVAYLSHQDDDLDERVIMDIDHEVKRFYLAIQKAQDDITRLRTQLCKEGAEEAAAILSAHLEIMKDPLLTICIEEQIRLQKKNAEYIFKHVVDEYTREFKKIQDLFFQERLKDFQDVFRRIYDYLSNKSTSLFGHFVEQCIVFMDDITPSDAVEATSHVLGFVTRGGSTTSHVAIMARARKIPWICNVDFPDMTHGDTMWVIMDGESGTIIFNPSEQTQRRYEDKKKQHHQDLDVFDRDTQHLPAETKDKVAIGLYANVEAMHELACLRECDIEGIGLLRTESLFMSKDHFPSEEEQLAIYETMVLENQMPIVIRTFDVGGDKFHKHHPTRYELNPYLGCRAIRLSFKEPRYFKTQIRAILRAGALGKISILLPMITKLEEVLFAKELIHEVQDSLRQDRLAFYENPLIGCMIETPAAALTIGHILLHCDFAAIGTNDLIQYTLAVDRNNPEMQELYAKPHGGVFRLIKYVIDEGLRLNKPISICGEMAADPHYLTLLIGLGVRNFSVPMSAIRPLKKMLQHIEANQAVQYAQDILNLPTSEEIHRRLEESIKQLSKIKIA